MLALSSVALELDKVAPFLIKLFEIVSSPATDYLVCWSDHGDSFKIIDRTKFAQVRATHNEQVHPTVPCVISDEARASHKVHPIPQTLNTLLSTPCPTGYPATVLQARQPAVVHPAA